MAKVKFYAVKNGFKTGIFTSWDECKEAVTGYSGAEYKSFANRDDAIAYINGETAPTVETNNDTAIAYVDGSYNIRNEQYGGGAVIFHNGKTIEWSNNGADKSAASMRNVAGEILASSYAMKYCVENEIPKLDIYFDYEGIEKWCIGEWKAKNIHTKSYKELYNECKAKVDITFHKVKAHSGNKYNDRADTLAKEACGM